MGSLEILKLIPVISAALVICEKLYTFSRQLILKKAFSISTSSAKI
jgi:hypothetical protein